MEVSMKTLAKTKRDGPPLRRPIGEWADTHQVSSGKNGNDACLGCHPSIASDLMENR